MFYDFPNSSDPIQQGDIFMDVPCIAFDSWDELSVLEEGEEPVSLTWQEIVTGKKDVVAILGIAPVPAIVATQTCDAQRKERITLCRIVELSEFSPFNEYERKSTKKLAEQLVTENRKRPGLFYLASDERIGFSKKMVVDFTNTIGVQREALENFLANRKGRLNKIACEHFREKLSHFFHRYAWNEWYILNKEEIGSHKEYFNYKPERLYDWQK